MIYIPYNSRNLHFQKWILRLCLIKVPVQHGVIKEYFTNMCLMVYCSLGLVITLDVSLYFQALNLDTNTDLPSCTCVCVCVSVSVCVSVCFGWELSLFLHTFNL